jgi:hypothetical protein
MNSYSKKTNVHPVLLVVLSGLVVLLLALPASAFLQSIHRYWRGNPEMAVVVSVALFIALVSFPSIVYIALKRRQSKPEVLGLIIIAAVCLGLVAIYFFWVSAFIRFPADILIWSESDFVNDILKIKTGYPLYTDQANNESFIYPPGVQAITYLVSLLIGNADSIPVYRGIQVVFSVIAAAIALFCAMRLTPAGPFSKPLNAALWGILGYALLFLVATNEITNPFTHNLHNDSLAQLVAITAFLLLVLYAQTGKNEFLIGMAVLPGLGFLVKQSLAIWAGLFLFYLIFFDRPFSLKKTLLFGVAAFGGVLLAVASGYVIWRDHFWYWVITVLRLRGVSLLRSIEHFTIVWPFVLAGFFGGLVVLRRENFRQKVGLWCVWLLLFVVEVYTSGVAWMLNHIGPASLIAGVWFLASLVRMSVEVGRIGVLNQLSQKWFASLLVTGLVLVILMGLGTVRIPIEPLSDDAYRYIKAIESYFQSEDSAKVLLDAGTWMYTDEQVIMKDRATTIGDRGYAQIGDFSGILDRIENLEYDRILVRNLNSPDFWYDHFLWEQPSGIRQALLDNYKEIGTIPAVQVDQDYLHYSYLFDTISVLEPKDFR